MRERRAPTLKEIQTDTLEIEANMTAARKAKGKHPVQEKGKAKEESSQNLRIEDMEKVIKNMTNKLAKMELENKNSQRQVQQNRGGFNPQFRRHPLQNIVEGKKGSRPSSSSIVYRINTRRANRR